MVVGPGAWRMSEDVSTTCTLCWVMRIPLLVLRSSLSRSEDKLICAGREVRELIEDYTMLRDPGWKCNATLPGGVSEGHPRMGC